MNASRNIDNSNYRIVIEPEDRIEHVMKCSMYIDKVVYIFI